MKWRKSPCLYTRSSLGSSRLLDLPQNLLSARKVRIAHGPEEPRGVAEARHAVILVEHLPERLLGASDDDRTLGRRAYPARRSLPGDSERTDACIHALAKNRVDRL